MSRGYLCLEQTPETRTENVRRHKNAAKTGALKIICFVGNTVTMCTHFGCVPETNGPLRIWRRTRWSEKVNQLITQSNENTGA